MPELPEVETVRRGLDSLTQGQTIQGGLVLLSRTVAHPVSVAEFCQGVQGRTMVSWHRRGKYLLGKLDRGWLGIHLRMTGQLLWCDRHSPLQKHARLRLFFPEDMELRFVDIRTFGKVWLVDEEEPEKVITGLQKLGPEPFGEDFTIEYLAQKLAKSNRCLKTLLLDQGLVAGIGNIYADEALFRSGIKPEAIASHLNLTQIENLRTAIIEVLQKAIEEGGTTFSDFLNLMGVNGNYGGVAWVYRRVGQPCRVCGTGIEKIKLGGRSTHFCPQCQS